MGTDHNSTIDDTVIEALRAQPRRYDVAIDDELVLSVLPNSVKTWTWVYDDPSDPHRKTLGIYPDMTLEDAKKSLAAEKQSYSRAGGPSSEFVIRDGRIQPATPSSQWPIIAGAAVAMIAVGVIVYLFIGGGTDGEPAGDDSSPFATSPSATDVQLPTISEPPATADTNDKSIATVTDNPDLIDDTVAETVTAVATPATGSPTSDDTTVADNPVADYTLSQDSGSLADKLDQRLGESVRTPPVTTIDPVSTGGTVTPADTPPVSDDNIQATSPVGTLIENTSPDLIVDSRVARGNLTNAVDAREPVDDLGSYIIGNGEQMQTYYFFTELRSLAGQRVRHRWLHRDRVVAEIPFNVGEAWRWRVYSSKTFVPSMSGQWHVQVLLDDDTVIYSLPFSFTP